MRERERERERRKSREKRGGRIHTYTHTGGEELNQFKSSVGGEDEEHI